jgi:hypothetical protein
MAFFAEYAAIPKSSTHYQSVQAVNEVVDFVFEEMVGAGGTLEDLAESGEEWLNSEKSSVYFELETGAGYSCNVRPAALAATSARVCRCSHCVTAAALVHTLLSVTVATRGVSCRARSCSSARRSAATCC